MNAGIDFDKEIDPTRVRDSLVLGMGTYYTNIIVLLKSVKLSLTNFYRVQKFKMSFKILVFLFVKGFWVRQ